MNAQDAAVRQHLLYASAELKDIVTAEWVPGTRIKINLLPDGAIGVEPNPNEPHTPRDFDFRLVYRDRDGGQGLQRKCDRSI